MDQHSSTEMSRSSPRQLQRQIVVVGAGVIGLTTAILLQEQTARRANINVTIVASEFPVPSPMQRFSDSETLTASASYASMWAGAHYRPIPHFQPMQTAYSRLSSSQQKFHCQLAREKDLALRTAQKMKHLAKSNPEAGVQIVPGFEYLENPPAENLNLQSGDIYASPGDGFRVFSEEELNTLNAKLDNTNTMGTGKVGWACEYSTWVINVHIYCAYLLQKFLQRGGKIVRKRLSHLSEAIDILPVQLIKNTKPVIVNCSGIGVSTDPATKIIRGQTVLVRNPFHSTITRQCADGTWSFLIPRPLSGGTIVGGTKQILDPGTKPRTEEQRSLLENAVRYFPEFVGDVNQFEIIADNVGQRPWREGGMRIEIETDKKEVRGQVEVVHGYGAGGRGYELSWGAAEKICMLVDRCLREGDKRSEKL